MSYLKTVQLLTAKFRNLKTNRPSTTAGCGATCRPSTPTTRRRRRPCPSRRVAETRPLSTRPRAQNYETFRVRNLRMFVIS
jgi:hypothetical protein